MAQKLLIVLLIMGKSFMVGHDGRGSMARHTHT